MTETLKIPISKLRETSLTGHILLPHPHVLLQMMRLSNAKRRLFAREERMRGTL